MAIYSVSVINTSQMNQYVYMQLSSYLWIKFTTSFISIENSLIVLLLGTVYTWRWKFIELAQTCTECRKLHVMSSMMQTCQNNLGLNLCVVPPMSHIVTISEDSLVRSYKERSKVHCHWCYELKPLELGKRTNSCIRVNIRELDRELFTK